MAQLNSGGPKLTVVAFDWNSSYWTVQVYYFNAAEELVKQNFPSYCLRRVDSRSK